MSTSFTPAQREALARDRHMIVTANAGAGKTSVLTERFLQIVLDDGVDLAKVVAITFTNKAAAQMRVRIGQKLRTVMENADGTQPQQRVHRAASILRRISMARISTFHAFCGSLLRTYADDAGIEADMRELLPRETNAMIADAVAQTVRHWMNDANGRDRLLELIDEVGINQMQKLVHALSSSSEQLHAITTWRSAIGSPAHIAQERHPLVLRLLQQRFLLQIDRIVAEIHKAGIPLKQAGIDLVARLIDQRDALANADPDAMREVCAGVTSLLSELLTIDGDLRQKLQAEKKTISVLRKTAFDALKDQLNLPWSADFEERQANLVDTLIAIAVDAQARYTSAKRERNGMDFDDLILQSTALLRNRADVASDVRKQITHLMIDEFQDTNPAQYELVSCLVPDLNPGSGQSVSPCPLLFIVGDGKQSIYGFRSADVRLFERAGIEIEAANSRRGWKSGHIALQASFRMAPACAAAINAVCSEVLVRESEFDVAYNPIVCGRTTVPDGVGSFRVIVTHTSADDADEDASARDIECDHVANVIARILSDPTHALTVGKHSHDVRNAGPSDIAILVRGVAAATSMADALRRRNVPCHVLAGSGFFSRPEVADIRNMLLWATDPADDLACMALMRSPLLRCTDADLHHIVCHGKGAMWERALRAAAAQDAPSQIVAAVAIMQDMLLDVRVLATSTFIRTTLLRCQWHQTILEDARRDQQLANIEKLIALINDASRRGMASIRDVILSITVPEKDKEAEELYDVGGDSVRIMTIHSSKGLDFPVVVLAGIHGKSGGNDTTFGNSDAVGPTLGIAAKVPQSTPPFALASRGILLSHAVNTSLQQQRDVAEDRRLLYVALTRAEDHVLVSIPYALTKNGELGAADGVGRVLRPFFHDRTALTDVDDQGWLLSYHQQMYANEQETTHLMHVRVPAILPDNVLCVIDRSRDGIPAGGNEMPPDVLDLSASLVDCVSLDMVSATEVLAASLRNEEPSAATVDADVDETRGAAYGTLVHYLLQQAARLQGTLDASALRDQLFDRLGSRDVSDMVRTAAVSEVMAVLHAPFLQTMSAALRNAALETSLTAVLDGVTIYGVMDVLLRGEDGCAEIWDWKTTSVHDRSDVTAAAASYQEQMQVYAWLLLMSDPTIDQVRTRLLFTKAIGVTDEWMVTQTWTREGLENVTTSLRSAIAGIKQRRATRAGLIVDSD